MAGAITIDDVPERWRDDVKVLLDMQPLTAQGGG